METRLTIKHLAPYLPYDIKWNFESEDFNHLVVGIENTTNGIILISPFNDYGRCDISDGKPILRPLSDLSKLGVDNIPINEHTINLMIEEKFNEDYGLFQHYKDYLELVKEGDSSQGYDSSKAISFEVFEEIRNELLKGHYDLFGLIEKGLAIDMNLINKQ